ncbi:hypothetical protein COX69_03375 [Candidatus Falkowbacteria bacterium CG_4_10_14_0_2_um_filter_48_10]|nr:MAG: hypothetical protein COX69_03375 [Candidatus Falkowbacteria bacterium CG_4_10_14_0_2_um_filter_48_10]
MQKMERGERAKRGGGEDGEGEASVSEVMCALINARVVFLSFWDNKSGCGAKAMRIRQSLRLTTTLF